MEKFNNKVEKESESRKTEIPKILEKFKTKFGRNFLIAIAVIASFIASTKESTAQGILNNPTEKEYKIGDDLEKEFQSQKEFYENWISNRTLEKKDLQKKFLKIKPAVLERLKKVTLRESSHELGAGLYRNDTIFIDPKEFNNPTMRTLPAHELTHAAFPVNYGEQPKKEFHSDMPEWMREKIIEAVKLSEKDSLASVSFFIFYYQRPEEVYARICALREKYNFKPNQVITEKDLEIPISKNKGPILGKTIEDDNTLILFKTITDKKALVKLLNELP